jgi:hypothetical protein
MDPLSSFFFTGVCLLMNPENISSPDAKQTAIAEMVGSIQRGESRYFFVGVVGYFIEGYPYPVWSKNSILFRSMVKAAVASNGRISECLRF